MIVFYIEKIYSLEYNSGVKIGINSYNLTVINLKKLFFTIIPILFSLLIFLFSFFIKEDYINTVKNSSVNPPTIIIDAGHPALKNTKKYYKSLKKCYKISEKSRKIAK